MSTQDLLVDRDGAILKVTFNRPDRRNALTFAMYDGLHAACERADSEDEVRVLLLSGAGDQAFVAGTDIEQFTGFTGGDDGVSYEESITRVINRLEDDRADDRGGARVLRRGRTRHRCRLRSPCRHAVDSVGNAHRAHARQLPFHEQLRATRRPPRPRAHARPSPPSSAHLWGGGRRCGLRREVCDDNALADVVEGIVESLHRNAPLSMWAAKQAAARLRRACLPDGDDLVRRVYASQDFRDGVRAFGDKRRMAWTGR